MSGVEPKPSWYNKITYRDVRATLEIAALVSGIALFIIGAGVPGLQHTSMAFIGGMMGAGGMMAGFYEFLLFGSGMKSSEIIPVKFPKKKHVR